MGIWPFSDLWYGLLTCRLTVNPLIVADYRKAEVFDMSGAFGIKRLDMARVFDNVWHTTETVVQRCSVK